MNMMMNPLLGALYGYGLQAAGIPSTGLPPRPQQFNYNPQIVDPHDQMNSTGVPYQRPLGLSGLPLPSDPGVVQGIPRRER